ncbi:MAG: acylphosphatase [archaeon]
MTVQLHIIVEGRVQGVFFRHNAKIQADTLGLAGWVRNLEDGRIEIVAQGQKKKLESLLEWASKGPPAGKVNKVTHELGQAKEKFTYFEIRR